MTTTVRSSSQNSGSSAAPSVAEPTGAAIGDRIIIHICMNGANTGADNNGSTPFTRKATQNGPIDGITIEVWERVKQSGDPSTFNFTCTSGRWTTVAAAWQSPDPTNFWDVVPTWTVEDGGPTYTGTSSAPDITTTSANAIHVAACGVDGTATTITGVPSGYTTVQKVEAQESQCVDTKVIAAAGATGAQTFVLGGLEANIGLSYAVRDYTAGTAFIPIIGRGPGLCLAGKSGLVS